MGVQCTVLTNGITIVTDTMAHLQSASLGIHVKAGSRNEEESEHGIAHLLEHMAFKGTGSRSARQIAEEIENVGGELNAATTTETTSYYARTLKDDLPLAVDILTDILTDSRFDHDELSREQHVVLQEIGAANDTPDDVVFDRFMETAWSDQPVGRPILGTAETVQSFTPDQLRSYLANNYSSDRIVVSAAGAVDHDVLVRQIEERLTGLPQAGTGREPQISQYTGGQFRETRDLMDAHILLGFEAPAYNARDFYASQVLSCVLGGGMSSRLFQEVREKRGLCYSVYAFHWGFSDTGLFGVHAATGSQDIPELMAVTISELQRAGQDISEAEVGRARAQIRAALLMAQESPSARASQMARQILLFGRPVTTEELLDRLAAISATRLRELSERLFVSGQPTLSAIGPIDGLVELGNIANDLSAAQDAAQKIAI